jgi:DNA-binding IclR family transcriptional regulator
LTVARRRRYRRSVYRPIVLLSRTLEEVDVMAARTAEPAESPSASGVELLDRAFAILFAFRADDPPLRLSELSRRTGLYKSTLLRLAGALCHHRFLVRLEDGRYRLGSTPFALGSVYQSALNLGEVLLPLMRELNRELGEAVSFHVREANHRVCLYRISSRFAVRTEVRQGDVQPLEPGAGGRVLAAFSGKAGALYDAIRRTCTYVSVGERDPETSGVSAPVFGVQQTLVGALGIVGPVNRLGRQQLAALRPRLLRTAAHATEQLGGDSRVLLRAADAADSEPTRSRRSLPATTTRKRARP